MATKASKETKKSLTEDVAENASPGIALLFSDINPDIAQDICSWILTENLAEDPAELLTLVINSPGGELASAFAIIEIMRGSRIPVRTIALGEVASAGLFIAASGHKGHRIITPTCSVMSHHFSGGATGDYHSLMNVQKEYKFTDKRIVDHFVRCTGLDEATIREKLIPNKDVYMSPDEALAINLFDEIRGLDQI